MKKIVKIVIFILVLFILCSIRYQTLENAAIDVNYVYDESVKVINPIQFIIYRVKLYNQQVKLGKEEDYLLNTCQGLELNCAIDPSVSTYQNYVNLDNILEENINFAIVKSLLDIEYYLNDMEVNNTRNDDEIAEYKSEYYKYAMINIAYLTEEERGEFLKSVDELKADIIKNGNLTLYSKTYDSTLPYTPLATRKQMEIENYFTYLNNESNIQTPSLKNSYSECGNIDTWFDHDAENEVLSLINKERTNPTKSGFPSVKALKPTGEDEFKADEWNKHMFETGELHHPGKSKIHSEKQSKYGENVLSNFSTNTVNDAQDIFEQWYNSPEHYENFMLEMYERTDLSVLRIDYTCDGEYDMTYATQRFY